MTKEIYNFAEKIFNFPRSITGAGVRQTLNEIKNILPELKILSIEVVQSFDWKIP